MTPNQRVVATAARYIGVRENPMGSNRGPLIDKWEAHWGMQGEPWCGMFASAVLREAGVTDVSHPATAVICSQGKARGWTTTKPVPGALIVWCGTHVEMLVSQVSPGVWNTIGGNVSDSVARKVRSLAGATLVVSPELRNNAPITQREFFLEDPHVTPQLFGPWRTKAARDAQIAKLKPGVREQARKVRIGRKYAFTLGRRVYGPWLDQAGRDSARPVLERRLGRTLRSFSRVIKDTGTPAAAEALGKTT